MCRPCVPFSGLVKVFRIVQISQRVEAEIVGGLNALVTASRNKSESRTGQGGFNHLSNFVVNVALGELAVAEFDFVTDKAISILCHDIEFTVTTFLRQIVGVATDLENGGRIRPIRLRRIKNC